jgi:hypothetical protein
MKTSFSSSKYSFSLAVVHLIWASALCVSWFWHPFYGLNLLQRVDFLVFWDSVAIGRLVEFFAFEVLRSHLTAEKFATVSMSLYALCFVVVGSVQWFLIGVVAETIWGRVRHKGFLS